MRRRPVGGTITRTTVAALATAAAGAATSTPGTARAGGFEYPDNGSVAFGRGGAFTARASDPTALMHNTAGIMGVEGFQITASSNLAFLQNCFSRSGVYDGSSVSTAGTPFAVPNHPRDPAAYLGANYPTVCNQNPIFIAPQLMATYRINNYVGVGFGLYGPNSVGQQEFPDTVHVTSVAGSQMGQSVAAPSPIRYMLLKENLLIVHPTLAVAASFPGPVGRMFRIGVGIQPSFAIFNLSTLANAVSSNAQSPNLDIRTDINAAGFFMAFNADAQFVAPRFISAGIHFHYNPDRITLGGHSDTTANYYTNMQIKSQFSVDRLETGLPIQARLGVRFALPRPGAPEQNHRNYDPMKHDIFDIEVDGIYERSSVFTNLSLANSGMIDLGSITPPPPRTIDIPHNWSDVWGVRVGGDVNVVPNVFALRAGVSYETGAIRNTASAHIDLPAHNTLGLHIGGTVRFRWLSLSAGYGHFFMDDIVSADGNLAVIGTSGPISGGDCMTSGAGSCTNNRGTYHASLDTVNIGATFGPF